MRTIFRNVDTQYDFMRPDGKLYVQGAERIEGNLAKLTELAATKGIKVVNTADWHNKDSKELSENPDFIQTFPEHCMESTLGAKFVPATSPQNAYWIDWREYYLNSKEIEEWPRLEVEIDGKKADSEAISEVYIGEESRLSMSRHILCYKGEKEMQKSSGLVACTGAGSMGWYSSASRYILGEDKIFERTKKEARFVLCEPHDKDYKVYKILDGSIQGDEVLEVQALNDSRGVVAIDSHRIIKLKEGSIVKIRLGRPLKVIKAR